MKKEPEKTRPELEAELRELQSRLVGLEKYYDLDPLEQALYIEHVRANLREAGCTELEIAATLGGTNLRAVAEQLTERVALLEKVGMFNAKYRDFFEDEFTMEKMAEYVRDTRWMLPIFIKVFGEESAEVKLMREIAGLEVEG